MAIREHRHEFLEILFLQEKFVWQEKIGLNLELDRDVLMKTVFSETAQRLNIAKNKLAKGKNKMSAKEAVHSLRF